MTTPWDNLSLKEKVHRVSELEGELSMLKADYADCNAERARWKTIAEAGQWQPIKTFDGRTQAVLVRCPERQNTYAACQRDGKWWVFGGNHNEVTEPISHWQPLPEPPSMIAASGHGNGGEG